MRDLREEHADPVLKEPGTGKWAVPDDERQDKARARFKREVAALGKLFHPHIVPVLDAGVEAVRPWLVMPRMRGGDLKKRANELRGNLEL